MPRRSSRLAAGKRVQRGDKAIASLLENALVASSEEIRLTHGFHTYPAGLHPDAARMLLDQFQGDRLFDPFCGGGTTLVEGRVHGRKTFGTDVSPVALRVANGRTATPTDELLTRFRSTARKLTEAARYADVNPEERIYEAVREWYAPHAIWELESLRQGIATSDESVRDLLWLAFSSLLIKVSWRASDTSARRKKHRRPPGTTAILFHKKVREFARRMTELRDAVPEGTPSSNIQYGDARTVRLEQKVQLVITSPPYPSTYDYLPLQHFRQIWLPDPPPNWDDEIGPRRDWREGGRGARAKWVEDTHAWTSNISAQLEKDGVMVVVIGDGLTPQGSIDAAKVTEEVAEANNLTLLGRSSVERPEHARKTTRWEHAFAFQKQVE